MTASVGCVLQAWCTFYWVVFLPGRCGSSADLYVCWMRSQPGLSTHCVLSPCVCLALLFPT